MKENTLHKLTVLNNINETYCICRKKSLFSSYLDQENRKEEELSFGK